MASILYLGRSTCRANFYRKALQSLLVACRAFSTVNVRDSEALKPHQKERSLPDGPSLRDFMVSQVLDTSYEQSTSSSSEFDSVPYLSKTDVLGKDRKGESIDHC